MNVEENEIGYLHGRVNIFVNVSVLQGHVGYMWMVRTDSCTRAHNKIYMTQTLVDHAAMQMQDRHIRLRRCSGVQGGTS